MIRRLSNEALVDLYYFWEFKSLFAVTGWKLGARGSAPVGGPPLNDDATTSEFDEYNRCDGYCNEYNDEDDYYNWFYDEYYKKDRQRDGFEK